MKGFYDAKRAARLRAPLLHVWFPLVLGYGCGRYMTLPLGVGTLAVIGVVLAGLSCVLAKWRGWWALSFYVAVMCLAWSAFVGRRPAGLERWADLPPREVELTLRVDRLYDTADRYERVGGIATVTEAPPHLRELIGQRVSFFLACNMEVYRSQEVRARGELLYHTQFPEQTGGFNYYLEDRAVHFRLQRGRILEERKPGWMLLRWCEHMRVRLQHSLMAGKDSEGVFPALVLGKKSLLDAGQQARFLSSGTMHFFAISGLHVGIVAGACYGLLRWLRVSQRWCAWLGLGWVFLYVQVAGGTPSAMRAFIMVAFVWGAQALVRRPSPLAALVASAVFLLLIAPEQWWSPGFRLSYAVVAGLLLYGAPLARLWGEYWLEGDYVPEGARSWRLRWRDGLGNWAGETLIVSFSAMLASAPLIAAYFGTFAPGAVVLNLPLFALVGVLLLGALAAGLIGLVWPVVGGGLLSLLEPLVQLIEWGLDGALGVPGLFVADIELSLMTAGLLTVFTLALMAWPAVARDTRSAGWRYGAAPAFTGVFWILQGLGAFA